jgi:hypothetical protein
MLIDSLRAQIVSRTNWVCPNCALKRRDNGWQALQVTDFKDPHYPAVW